MFSAGCGSVVSSDAEGSLDWQLGARMQRRTTPLEPILGAHSKAGAHTLTTAAPTAPPDQPNIEGQVGISRGRKSKRQIRSSFQGQAQFLNLHYHQLLSQARHECLMKERVDKRDDILLEKNTIFSSSGSWSSDLPLDYDFYYLKKKKTFYFALG